MSLFSRNVFQRTIKDYCNRCGWRIAEIDDSYAKLIFTMPSGQDQALFIVPYQSTLEFSVPSALMVDRLEDIPHELSTKLLQRSSETKIGFWCIEEIGDNYVYSYMHNAEIQLINLEYFANVVQTLIIECEEFEQQLGQFAQRRTRRW